MANEMSLSALWGVLHREPGYEPSKNVTFFRVAEAFSVPRLRRSLQDGGSNWMAAEELEPL